MNNPTDIASTAAETSAPETDFFHVSQSITANRNTREVFCEEKPVPLSEESQTLLFYFIENAHRMVSRQEIVTTALGKPVYSTNIAAGALNRLARS